MSHYRLFDWKPKLWECAIWSWSKCQCHTQEGFWQAQLLNTHANIDVPATSRPIGFLPYRYRREYSGKNKKFLCSSGFYGTWHARRHEEPLILGRPFLSTTNAHIDVRVSEIKFHINGKEEWFAFKPRPEQCSNLEWHEKQEQPSESPSPRPTDAPRNNYN
jgi:hypothetical protein